MRGPVQAGIQVVSIAWRSVPMGGFWSLVKNGIRGVYHSVSPKYLQQYLNEYSFRYNHRNDVTPMFLTFLRRACQTVDVLDGMDSF